MIQNVKRHLVRGLEIRYLGIQCSHLLITWGFIEVSPNLPLDFLAILIMFKFMFYLTFIEACVVIKYTCT